MKPISIMALQQIPGVGVKTCEKILSLSSISEPTCPFDLIEILKKVNLEIGKINIPELQAATNAWDKAHEILKLSQQQNINIISRESTHYPECLLRIETPPVLLHVKGNIDALNKDSIAIVGTRKPSDFGRTQAKKIAGLFAREGYVIVSGLAEGIDSAAHIGALETKGLTVAVLAHGLDFIYPYKNKELANTIIKNNGALVSEYPFGTRIVPRYFVERDRIQSGLSLGVMVVETGIKGGTMHTVGFCEKQKRTLIVMKHPKHLLDASKQCGNTKLITENRANIVFDSDDSMDLVKDLIQTKKDEFFSLKPSHYISPLTTDDFKRPIINTSEVTLTYPPPYPPNSLLRIDGLAQSTIKNIKEEKLEFVSANKLNLPVSSASYAQPTKKKRRRKKINPTDIFRKFEEFEGIAP